MMKRQPMLATMSPERMLRNVQEIARDLGAYGLTVSQYVSAAKRYPALLTCKPATIIGNLKGFVAAMDMPELQLMQYVKAALRQPTLFCLHPQRLRANVDRVILECSVPELTAEIYLKGCLLHPNLFYQRPSTISKHLHMILDMQRRELFAIGRSKPGEGEVERLIRYLMNNPHILSLSDENLALRRQYAELIGTPQDTKLFRMPKKEVEDKVRELARTQTYFNRAG